MDKIKIEVATKSRGFLDVLYNYKFDNFEFINNEEIFEVPQKRKKLLYKIFMSKLFDKLGIIQIVNKKTDYDGLISYNRFLSTNKPYIIILENPTALFHYRLGRNKGIYAKRKIIECINDKNLKAIVCISKACYETFNQIYSIDHSEKLYQIYPLILDTTNKNVSKTNRILSCLYVSSDFYLKSGAELLEVASLQKSVEFTIITKINSIDNCDIEKIKNMSNVTLIEFNLSKDELQKIYNKNDILIHLTRQDSYSLVIFEAIKSNLSIIATSVYAIPEMVKNNRNGFLTNPKYYFFDKQNMPNKEVWCNRENTIYSKYIDTDIIEFLNNKLEYLLANPNVLDQMKKENEKIVSLEFSEKKIVKQWENLIMTIFQGDRLC